MVKGAFCEGTGRGAGISVCGIVYPACQQGLERYREDTGLDTDYIVVELARKILGPQWQQGFIDAAHRGGIERVLL